MSDTPYLQRLDVLAEGEPDNDLITIEAWQFLREFDWAGLCELTDSAQGLRLPDIQVDAADRSFELHLCESYHWPEFFADIPGITVLSARGAQHSMVSGAHYLITQERPEHFDLVTARLRAAIAALEAERPRLETAIDAWIEEQKTRRRLRRAANKRPAGT